MAHGHDDGMLGVDGPGGAAPAVWGGDDDLLLGM
jgi:hypothetical protein